MDPPSSSSTPNAAASTKSPKHWRHCRHQRSLFRRRAASYLVAIIRVKTTRSWRSGHAHMLAVAGVTKTETIAFLPRLLAPRPRSMFSIGF